MRKEDYKDSGKKHVRQSAEELGLGHHWIFQQDNDAKHTAKAVMKWITEKNIFKWPSQCPDLNQKRSGPKSQWRHAKILLAIIRTIIGVTAYKGSAIDN